MRITIEDSQGINSVNPVQLETNPAQDSIDAGGSPSLPNSSQAPLTKQMANTPEGAGSPPAWLIETIGQAFAQDPGRFDVVAEPSNQMMDGGAAPSSKS